MRSYEKPFTLENLLEDPDIAKIEKNIQTDEEILIFHGIIYTGLRVTEFVHLRRSWIDFDEHIIRVPKTQPCNCKGCIYIRNKLRKKLIRFQEQNKKITRKKQKRYKTMLEGNWVPKTGRSARTIPIYKVQAAQDVLYPYFKEHKLMLETFPLRQYVNNILNNLGERSKIKIFPHALRGTFATMLAVQKFPVLDITQILGWADPKTAMDYILLSGSALLDTYAEKWVR